MTKFNVNCKYGVYTFVIHDNNSTTTLYLDAKELVDLYNEVDFFHEQAEYEISKINKAED